MVLHSAISTFPSHLSRGRLVTPPAPYQPVAAVDQERMREDPHPSHLADRIQERDVPRFLIPPRDPGEDRVHQDQGDRGRYVNPARTEPRYEAPIGKDAYNDPHSDVDGQQPRQLANRWKRVL